MRETERKCWIKDRNKKERDGERMCYRTIGRKREGCRDRDIVQCLTSVLVNLFSRAGKHLVITP